jgi:hypothetical protein
MVVPAPLTMFAVRPVGGGGEDRLNRSPVDSTRAPGSRRKLTVPG